MITPLGQKIWMWDYYPQAKLLAEKLAWEFPRVTVVRPSWLYGPRDRITIPRVIPALLERRVPIIGSGENYLNLIYAGDVARGCILAARHPGAVGQAYNLCSEGEIRQVDNRGGWHEKAKDPLPSWLPMPAEVAARKIVRAVYRRRREAIITAHGKALVWLSRFAPWVLRFAARRGVRGRSEPKRQ